MIDHTLRELESFTAVAEELSFTRAAARLRVAQPVVSRSIAAIEMRIGAKLFLRSGRAVALTSAGRAFYDDVHEPLLRLERASIAARQAAAGETARLEIGFVSSLLDPDLAGFFRAFKQANPKVHLTLHDLTPVDQLDRIAGGRLDGGFVGTAPSRRPAGIDFLPWKREPVRLFLPHDHVLANRRSVALKQIAREPVVAIAAHTAPAFASRVRDLCRSAGFQPRIVQEARRAQAVVAMVAAGSGVAILPASVARVAGDAVAVCSLSGDTAETDYVFARKSDQHSSALEAFAALVLRRFRVSGTA